MGHCVSSIKECGGLEADADELFQTGNDAGMCEAFPYGNTENTWVTHTGKSEEESPKDSCSLHLYVGILDFKNLDYGLGGGIFEEVFFRVIVSCGTSVAKLSDKAPSTRALPARFRRVVSDSGRYNTIVSCVFDEHIGLPWPGEKEDENPFPLSCIAVDVWLEKATVFETVEKFLGQLGIGDGPTLDHIWVGRAAVDIPSWGVDSVPQPVSILANCQSDCPEPSSITIGIKWVEN